MNILGISCFYHNSAADLVREAVYAGWIYKVPINDFRQGVSGFVRI